MCSSTNHSRMGREAPLEGILRNSGNPRTSRAEHAGICPSPRESEVLCSLCFDRCAPPRGRLGSCVFARCGACLQKRDRHAHTVTSPPAPASRMCALHVPMLITLSHRLSNHLPPISRALAGQCPSCYLVTVAARVDRAHLYSRSTCIVNGSAAAMECAVSRTFRVVHCNFRGHGLCDGPILQHHVGTIANPYMRTAADRLQYARRLGLLVVLLGSELLWSAWRRHSCGPRDSHVCQPCCRLASHVRPGCIGSSVLLGFLYQCTTR